jgi:hypothetical protein
VTAFLPIFAATRYRAADLRSLVVDQVLERSEDASGWGNGVGWEDKREQRLQNSRSEDVREGWSNRNYHANEEELKLHSQRIGDGKRSKGRVRELSKRTEWCYSANVEALLYGPAGSISGPVRPHMQMRMSGGQFTFVKENGN